MKKLLGFDTETTGLPDWKAPSGDPAQPHLVQLAAVMYDSETKQSVQTLDVIVRPDGWVIPPALTAIHGISHEEAMDIGVPEHIALEMFVSLYRSSDLRIAHNTTFDNRIIRIALKRHMPDAISDDEWKDRGGYYCTLMNARKLMGGSSGHTLAEVYRHYIGKELENAHTAIADTKACMEVYFAMQEAAAA